MSFMQPALHPCSPARIRLRRLVTGFLRTAGLCIGLFAAPGVHAGECNGVHAGELEETWIIRTAPNETDLEDWGRQPGSRNYRIALEDPSSQELDLLLELPSADRVEVQLDGMPTADIEGALTRLSRRFTGKFHLVTLEGMLPSSSNASVIERLNRITPAKAIFVITGPQDPADSAALARLNFPTQVTYATRVFPRYADRASWDRIPATTPLLIATDYWPQYTAMDLLNLLPMPQRIRVLDSFPPQDSLPYLRAIRKLEEITVDTDFDPSGGFRWEDLGTASVVRWNRRGTIPGHEALATFCGTNAAPVQRRKLIFDSDYPPSAEEVAALSACAARIPVEWIHAP